MYAEVILSTYDAYLAEQLKKAAGPQSPTSQTPGGSLAKHQTLHRMSTSSSTSSVSSPTTSSAPMDSPGFSRVHNVICQ
ncbi:MAG: hypothetical protein MMC23_003869 [Stictis urceolatum]|nr:hypothetical protein [Stictis urceolata]